MMSGGVIMGGRYNCGVEYWDNGNALIINEALSQIQVGLFVCPSSDPMGGGRKKKVEIPIFFFSATKQEGVMNENSQDKPTQ